MSQADPALVLVAERYNRLMERARQNPSLFTEAGCVKIVSPWSVGTNGEMIRHASEEAFKQWEREVEAADVEASDPKLGTAPRAPKNFIKEFRYNYCQSRLDDGQKLMRRRGKGVNLNILKARRQGITTKILSDILGHMVTMSGFQAIMVAHDPQATLKIMRMLREMIRNLPLWMNMESPIDNAQQISVESQLWGIVQSVARSVHESKIDELKGDGAIFLFNDEAAYYQNHEKVQTSMNPLLQVDELMTYIKASTGNGSDPMFSPDFVNGWNAQGQKNYWQKGVSLWRYESMSIFFPWYFDFNQCRLQIHNGALGCSYKKAVERVYETLDAYENDMVRTHLIPFWEMQKKSPEEIRINVAEQVNWRRAKTRWNISTWPTEGGGVSYQNLRLFAHEYPLTPEEALYTDEASLLLGEYLDQIRATVSLPMLQCGLTDEGEPVVFNKSDLTGDARFQIYKDRDEVKGPIVAFFDGAPGIAGYSGGSINWDRDFFALVVFERLKDGTLIQIGQYRSQLSSIKTSDDCWRFMKYWNKGRRAADWAFFGGYILYGDDCYSLFLDRGYPLDKMFRRRQKDNPNATDRGLLGIAETKDTNITAAFDLFDMVGRGKMVLRSSELLEEASNYQDKGGGVCEAQHKNKGGRSSKDDLIKACSGLAYVIKLWNYDALFASMTRDDTRDSLAAWNRKVRGVVGPQTVKQMEEEAFKRLALPSRDPASNPDADPHFGVLAGSDAD